MLFLLQVTHVSGQDSIQTRRFGDFFDSAYRQFPTIPRGILEGVAFANTGINDITYAANAPVSCVGLPRIYGVMGLMEDGKGVFRNSLTLVAGLSGYSAADIRRSPLKSILAYAKAYVSLQKKYPARQLEEQTPILTELSEIKGNSYALNYQLYTVYSFLNNTRYQSLFRFPAYRINLRSLFGDQTLRVLRSPLVSLAPAAGGGDYAPATWDPAPSCNYTVGRTMPITAIVIHDGEGNYQDIISWFKDCSGQVSAHYVISKFGQITQMVLEKDKAWHARSANPYTIGIEHEGWCGKDLYTDTMYKASALLVRDICGRQNIDRTTTYNGQPCPCDTCVKSDQILVKGHQMYPNQTHTDPGPTWNWQRYYGLIQ